MWLGNKNGKTLFYVLYCARLFVSLNKIGFGSEKPKLKTAFFICLFTHLSLFLYSEFLL